MRINRKIRVTGHWLLVALTVLPMIATVVAVEYQAPPAMIAQELQNLQGTDSRSGHDASQQSLIEWESLGFSQDGAFFAGISYGVEYNLNRDESEYVARLQVLHLGDSRGGVVFEKTLRSSGSLRSGLTARSIMQDLLRRESRELRKFRIQALEQGDVLLFVEEGTQLDKLSESDGPNDSARNTADSPVQSSAAALGKMSLMGFASETGAANTDKNDFEVALTELLKVQNAQEMLAQEQSMAPDVLDRIYTITRNANTTVFQIKQLRLDSANSLRGQLLAAQSRGFPHRYNFQQNWQTLLVHKLYSDEQLNLRPVYISLSPDASHLVLTIRIYREADEQGSPGGEEAAQNSGGRENSVSTGAWTGDGPQWRSNGNYAFVTFAVQVY